MKLSFKTKKVGVYPFPINEYYYHIHILGIWTPFCRKWNGDTNKLPYAGFPGRTLKKVFKNLSQQWHNLCLTYRLARRLFTVRKINRQAAYEYFLSLGDHEAYNIYYVAKHFDDLGFHTTVTTDGKILYVNGSPLYAVNVDYGYPGIDGIKIGVCLYELLSRKSFQTDYLGREWIYRDILAKLKELADRKKKYNKRETETKNGEQL